MGRVVRCLEDVIEDLAEKRLLHSREHDLDVLGVDGARVMRVDLVLVAWLIHADEFVANVLFAFLGIVGAYGWVRE